MLDRVHHDRTIEPTVFWVSSALIVVFVFLSFFYTRELGETFTAVQQAFSTYAGWVYILGVNIFLLFSIWLIFSRFGDIRLGGKGAQPDFTVWGWLAMLFSAGMGIGLVFWSVAEPMYHFATPPQLVEAESREAAAMAMAVTFFHWGLHAWGIYAVIALALAFFSFNRGLPLTIRSAFHPLLGDKIHGPVGKLIDILAVLATMFGLATSLGLGAQQVNAGLNRLFGIATTETIQVVIIILITIVAVTSVVLGLDKGIKRLSQINMVAAAVLLLFVLMAGPSLFIIESLLQIIGSYLQHLLRMATWTESYTRTDWQHSWTLFYWAWWIAWSPFVGMFIARISRGRTIREFMLGVLLTPTVLTAIWLTVFGGSALHAQLEGNGQVLAAVNENVATALYALLELFPMGSLFSMLAIFVVVTFFVTSSDSGSLVIDTITSGGHPNPPVRQKIFWASTEGVVASALLMAGGLKALQAGSILTGLPFTFVLLFMCYSLYKGLAEDWAANT